MPPVRSPPELPPMPAEPAALPDPEPFIPMALPDAVFQPLPDIEPFQECITDEVDGNFDHDEAFATLQAEVERMQQEQQQAEVRQPQLRASSPSPSEKRTYDQITEESDMRVDLSGGGRAMTPKSSRPSSAGSRGGRAGRPPPFPSSAPVDAVPFINTNPVVDTISQDVAQQLSQVLTVQANFRRHRAGGD